MLKIGDVVNDGIVTAIHYVVKGAIKKTMYLIQEDTKSYYIAEDIATS